MELIPVTCNHCGAALQVSDAARFVTCRYCNSQLEIKRTDSAVSTEVLQRIDQNTAAMADDLHVLRRDSELERLDREWDQRRQGLMTRRRDGSSAAPAAAVGYIMIFGGGLFGLVWVIIASLIAGGIGFALHSHGGSVVSFLPCIFPFLGLLIIGVNTAFGIFIIRAASKYKQEEQQYLRSRAQLLAAAAQDPTAAEPR
jgi:hypothetical protein